MPETWTEPELFLYHNGVAVYHCYRNGYLNSGKMEYWYTTDIEEQLGDFDIRDLPSYQCGADHKTILTAAIDNKELQVPEEVRKPLVQEVNILLAFPELNELPEILHCMIAPDTDKADVCTTFENALTTARQNKDTDCLT